MPAPPPEARTWVDAYSPSEATSIMIRASLYKKRQPIDVILYKAFLAGVFLSFSGLMTLFIAGGAAGIGSTNPGIQITLGAFVYPIGLVLIVLTGAELVTSNMMVFMLSILSRNCTLLDLLKSWVLSWIGNLIGSIFVGYILVYFTGILQVEPYNSYSQEFTMKHLGNLQWHQIFLRAVGANWLVCLAVFLSTCSKDIFSKIIAIWLPVWLFVTVGYEHIVANMFLVQMGMYLGAPLSVGKYIWLGMIPVTLGNIVGGGLFVGTSYWYLYVVRKTEGISIGGVMAGPETRDGTDYHLEKADSINHQRMDLPFHQTRSYKENNAEASTVKFGAGNNSPRDSATDGSQIIEGQSLSRSQSPSRVRTESWSGTTGGSTNGYRNSSMPTLDEKADVKKSPEHMV